MPYYIVSDSFTISRRMLVEADNVDEALNAAGAKTVTLSEEIESDSFTPFELEGRLAAPVAASAVTALHKLEQLQGLLEDEHRRHAAVFLDAPLEQENPA